MPTPVTQLLPVNPTACEQVLGITELAQEIIASLHDDPRCLRSLALTNKEQSENALRQLWSKKCGLKDFFQFLPSPKSTDISPEGNHNTITRDFDSFERLKKYMGYVREFTWGSEDDSRSTTSDSVDHLFEAIPSHQNLFPNLRALRWSSKSSETRAILSRLLGPSVVDVQILKCPLMDVGEHINILKQRAPRLQRLDVELSVHNPNYQILLESKPQVTSEDDVLFPHLQALLWTSIPADCHGIFRRLVGPSLVDLHIFGCSSADATEYAKLISQRAPGLQRLEMEVDPDSDSKHLLKVKLKPKPKPKTMFQDQVLFPDLRVLRWTSQCSDSPKLFRQLLGPSVVDLHILNSSLANAREYVKIIRQRTHGLQRLEVNLDHNDHLEPLPELELDGMDINKFKTNCTLSEEAFFSLATMTHLTSLELAVPEEGYAEVSKEGDEDTPQEVYEEVPEEDHKDVPGEDHEDVPEEVCEEVPHTSCFPALRSLRLETEELGKHCTALVKKISSSNLDSISVDVENDVTTDMLESFVCELVNYPLREFSLACTASNIRHDHDDGLDIAEATLHALQPLLQHRAMTLLAIRINNLRITPHLLSALDSAYPALKMLLLHTDSSHSPKVDILSTLADSFPSLKEADISVTDTWKLLTLPRDWQSHSKLSTLHVTNTIWYWVSDSKVLAYLKALFPRAYIGLS